jgi:hypothetical protein
MMRRARLVMLSFPLLAPMLLGQFASAEEVLDQQSPGPIGFGQSPSDAVEWAQSFTVGVTGTLSRIDVYVAKIFAVIENLTVTIYDADSGVPTTSLGSATLLSGPMSSMAAFHSVDVSGLAISVTAGDKLAFGLKKAPDSGIHIMPFDGGNPYAGGNTFSRNLGPPILAWVAQPTADFGFKTYVNVEEDTELFGDYNDDGTIDAVDYTVWRNTFGSGGSLLHDATPESVAEEDYDYWKAHYGESSPGSGGLAVPEPTSILLAVAGIIATAISRRRPR